ncbi:MAG: phage protein Gp36 family protein [Anaerovoracaceae bacterium]
MGYCTTQAVREMLKYDVMQSLLGDSDYPEGEELEERMLPKIEAATADAEAEINGYLCIRYPVPLTNVPDMICKICKDIAVYNLVSRSGIDEGERDSNYLTRYKAAISYLTKVAEGKLDLEGQTSSSQGAGQNTSFGFISNKPLFKRSSMRNL